MRFIVIIPTFNEAENLPDCLESIREATPPLPTSADVAAASTESVTVVVSDGGSSDGTVDIARERGASIVSKAPMPHVGRGAQLSHAIASVTTPPDAFLFLHADCRLQRGAFSALAEAFRGGACRAEDTCKRPRPRVGVVTMRIRFRVPKSASARQRWLLNRAEAWCNEEKGGLYRSFGDDTGGAGRAERRVQALAAFRGRGLLPPGAVVREKAAAAGGAQAARPRRRGRGGAGVPAALRAGRLREVRSQVLVPHHPLQLGGRRPEAQSHVCAGQEREEQAEKDAAAAAAATTTTTPRTDDNEALQ